MHSGRVLHRKVSTTLPEIRVTASVSTTNHQNFMSLHLERASVEYVGNYVKNTLDDLPISTGSKSRLGVIAAGCY